MCQHREGLFLLCAPLRLCRIQRDTMRFCRLPKPVAEQHTDALTRVKSQFANKSMLLLGEVNPEHLGLGPYLFGSLHNAHTVKEFYECANNIL
jgi:hypothetical protein